MLAFHCNEEVAVMPVGASSPTDVLQIARVASVSRTFIRTNEQRIYAVHDGRDFSRRRGRYIGIRFSNRTGICRHVHLFVCATECGMWRRWL
jgi:hypothetical protein